MLFRISPLKRLFSHSIRPFFFSTQEPSPPPESFNPFDIFDIGSAPSFKGSLVIIPTPIGNLRDLSIRQYEALLAVDIIACEDTRITGNLLNLIKKRKIKDQMEDQFGVNLKDLKPEANQMDENDVFDKKAPEDLKTEDKKLRELVSNTVLGTEVKDFEERKRMREELRIKALKTKAKRVLEGLDTLSFMAGVDKDEGQNQDDVYGLEDDFMSYLKKKIAETRVRKGRGILLSYYKHNEEARIGKLIKAMKYGFKIGLVCDAGTPTISDPGYKLVDTALREGIIIEALPGPSSVSVALSLSGFPSDSFSFEGYLSKSPDERAKKLMKSKESLMTCVFFENVQRLEKTLLMVEKVYGSNHMIFLALELTKLHQKTYRKTVGEMITFCNSDELVHKGELTIVVPPYLRKFNKDIQVNKLEEEISPDIIKPRKSQKEEDEKEKAKEKVHEIHEEHLMEVFDSMFDITDKQMGEVVENILKVSPSRAMHLVRRFRTQKTNKHSKFFDPELFRYDKNS